MGFFSKKTEVKQRLFAGSPSELAAMGEAGFGGGGGPGINLLQTDYLVVPAYERAGFPSSGTPGFDAFTNQFMTELQAEAESGGGWALVAAAFVGQNFLPEGSGSDSPQYWSIIKQAASFLRENNVDGYAVPTFLANEIFRQESS